MTEKRFYTEGKYVMQEGEVWVICSGEHNADVVATALNELIEERNKLQFDYNMEILTRQSIEKENEQLKSVNMEMEDCLGRLEEANINLRIKLKKIRDYAKEEGEVKQGIIEKVILND